MKGLLPSADKGYVNGASQRRKHANTGECTSISLSVCSKRKAREFKEVSHQEAAAILLEGETVRTLGGSFLGSKTVVGKLSEGCQRTIKPELSVNVT